jgi:hypothetical protein
MSVIPVIHLLKRSPTIHHIWALALPKYGYLCLVVVRMALFALPTLVDSFGA